MFRNPAKTPSVRNAVKSSRKGRKKVELKTQDDARTTQYRCSGKYSSLPHPSPSPFPPAPGFLSTKWRTGKARGPSISVPSTRLLRFVLLHFRFIFISTPLPPSPSLFLSLSFSLSLSLSLSLFPFASGFVRANSNCFILTSWSWRSATLVWVLLLQARRCKVFFCFFFVLVFFPFFPFHRPFDWVDIEWCAGKKKDFSPFLPFGPGAWENAVTHGTPGGLVYVDTVVRD